MSLEITVLGHEYQYLGKKQHVIYVVNVRQEQTGWENQVRKRFSDFKQLHKSLQHAINALNTKVERLPSFPSMFRLTYKLTEPQIDKRMVKLELYLNQLEKHVMCRSFRHFKDFFRLPRKVHQIWANFYGGIKAIGKNKALLTKMNQSFRSEYSLSQSDMLGSVRLDRPASALFNNFENKYSKSYTDLGHSGHSNSAAAYHQEIKEFDPSGNGRGRPTNQGLYDKKQNESPPERSRTHVFLDESANSSMYRQEQHQHFQTSDAGYFPEKYLERRNDFAFEKRNQFKTFEVPRARTYEFSEEEEKQQMAPKAGDIYEPQSTSLISRSDLDIDVAGGPSRNAMTVNNVSEGSFGALPTLNKTSPVQDTIKKVTNSSFPRDSFLDDSYFRRDRREDDEEGSIGSLDTSVINEPIDPPPSVQCIHDSHSHFSKTYFMLTKE